MYKFKYSTYMYTYMYTYMCTYMFTYMYILYVYAHPLVTRREWHTKAGLRLFSSYPKLYEIVSDRSASNGNCTGILNDAMLVLLQSMEHEHQSNSLLLRIFILCV